MKTINYFKLYFQKIFGSCSDAPCPNLLMGDSSLILIPSDFYLGLLKTLNMSSLQDLPTLADATKKKLTEYIVFVTVTFTLYEKR